MKIEMTKKEKLFFNAYKEAIYFTETGDDQQPDPDTELCEVFERESAIDCLAFFSRVQCYLSDDQIEQAGHDFWLTRNGHGTGFWDKPEFYTEKYTRITLAKIATSFGEVCSYFEEIKTIA